MSNQKCDFFFIDLFQPMKGGDGFYILGPTNRSSDDLARLEDLRILCWGSHSDQIAVHAPPRRDVFEIFNALDVVSRSCQFPEQGLMTVSIPKTLAEELESSHIRYLASNPLRVVCFEIQMELRGEAWSTRLPKNSLLSHPRYQAATRQLSEAGRDPSFLSGAVGVPVLVRVRDQNDVADGVLTLGSDLHLALFLPHQKAVSPLNIGALIEYQGRVLGRIIAITAERSVEEEEARWQRHLNLSEIESEHAWLRSTYPPSMISFLNGRTSERKLRRFAVACCRRIEHLIVDNANRHALAVAERYADGEAPEAERQEAEANVVIAPTEPEDSDMPAQAIFQAASAVRATVADEMSRYIDSFETNTWVACRDASMAAAYTTSVVPPPATHWSEAQEREFAFQCALLRDIIGNPFKPVQVQSEWLSSQVVSLARAIYEERAFARMPVLADALEEAGCHEPQILEHCRLVGNHDRGCWVVDSLLERELQAKEGRMRIMFRDDPPIEGLPVFEFDEAAGEMKEIAYDDVKGIMKKDSTDSEANGES